MKIAFCYPSFAEASEGKPLLSQNRQFQWYKGAFSYSVYPVVMASAATLMKKMGHEVFWWDYIAEGKTFAEFVREFLRIKPDLAVFETKTPVVKKHWEIINFLKKKRPLTKFVLCGDHVTAEPAESLKNSLVDYVLLGGDYDFLLMSLIAGGFLWGKFGQKDQSQKQSNKGKAETNLEISEKFGQIYHRLPKISSILTARSIQTIASNRFPVNTHGSFIVGRVKSNPTEESVNMEDKTLSCEERSLMDKDIKVIVLNGLRFVKLSKIFELDDLPMIGRELTKWKMYAFNNGNFRYTPGAYTMAGRDCWWRRRKLPITNGQLPMEHQFSNSKIQVGGCSFCSWTGLYPKWKVVKPEKLLDEIEYLISLGVKEVFDDTGTFPVGDWLKRFSRGMIKRGYNKKIRFGCNMRAGVLKQNDYELMYRAGFRFVLFGLESANDKTLEKLNKGYTVGEVIEAVTMAKKAGLSPHVTVMFGYPWESERQAKNTVLLCRDLFNKGVIDSLQATLVIPYPGTKLFEECKKEGFLRTLDWEKYDMRMPVMRCPIADKRLFELIRECYSTVLTPKFLIRQIGQIRNIGDIKHLGFLGGKYLSKMGDFR